MVAPFESLDRPSLPGVLLVDPKTQKPLRGFALVGAPGIWPPATLTSGPEGYLYLPNTDVETLRGERFLYYEIMARAAERPLAHWGGVDFGETAGGGEWPERRVELQPASTIEVQVVGTGGEPVSGAEVQLSRRRIGFVSLSKHTGPKGGARFRAIPTGEYLVSAHNSSRMAGEAKVVHDSSEPSSLTVELERQAPRRVDEERAPPQEVSVRIAGLSESAWSGATPRWRPEGGAWQLATLLPSDQPGVRTWQKRLTPGSYRLKVETAEGTSDAKRLSVSEDSASFEWRVDLRRRVPIYVVDAYGSPVEGALVQIWRDGQLVQSQQSRGGEPIGATLRAGAEYRAVAIDARRGEAERSFEPTGVQGEVTLKIDEPLFSSARPPGRVRERGRIEEILEVPLVADADSWMIDATDPESRAVRAGLERGDRLMSLHAAKGGWTAVVQRDGAIVEVPVKRDE